MASVVSVSRDSSPPRLASAGRSRRRPGRRHFRHFQHRHQHHCFAAAFSPSDGRDGADCCFDEIDDDDDADADDVVVGVVVVVVDDDDDPKEADDYDDDYYDSRGKSLSPF